MMIFKPKINVLSVAVAVALTGIIVGCNDSDDSSSTVKDNAYYKAQAESLIAKMSIAEQLNMLIGPGYDTSTWTINTAAVANLNGAVDGAAGYISGVLNTDEGVDVAAAVLADGPAGIRISPTRDDEAGTFYATGFPVGTLLASSWNLELAQEVGAAAGNEAKEYGVDFWLAPGMNIQRNPLNGRNFEYYSEDPLVAGAMAAAITEGSQSEGVATTIKHFVANNSETNRMNVDNIISPRALREIYLRGFQYAVENAQPWALMTSYNKVNGTYTSQRSDLVTSVLRDEWGYEGMVMSDWFAGDDPVAQLNAGNDLIQPGGVNFANGSDYTDYLTRVQSAYTNGEITDSVITTDATRILTQMLKTTTNQGVGGSNNPDLNAHAEISKQAAEEGMVLLKNSDSTLPIDTSKTIASFGVGQINTLKGGTGSGDVHSAYVTTIAEGLAKQFTLDSTLTSYYEAFYEANKVETTDSFGVSTVVTCDEADVSATDIATYAANDDIAVITLGRNSGEGTDRTNTAGDYQLTEVETNLISNVATAFHNEGKKVVVVLNIAGVIDTSWKDEVDGILLAYMPGQEAGDAIADLLSGAANPSGKLAQTFPESYDDVPSATTFTGEDTDSDGTVDTNYYNEDIYVGYRYYDSFNKAVSYPFGFGLSYTSFDYSGAAVASNTLDSDGAKGVVTLTATITNSGAVAGKEVAQVYINAPEVKLKKPTIELKAFGKTDELDPAASQTLTFSIPAAVLASFDADENEWIIEPGTYNAYISPSSDVSSVTAVTFSVADEIVVSTTTAGALALPDGVSAADFVTVSE
ncbi:glycoside hydrolase family 3 C-terminal domain-containing protein [Pseudaeromonas sp. ZJS20]|uniref:beta-glucosidase n=1 Tax=Pseudaeromonas aegiceratis TaxID=3153928 RepID=UPI00390C862A